MDRVKYLHELARQADAIRVDGQIVEQRGILIHPMLWKQDASSLVLRFRNEYGEIDVVTFTEGELRAAQITEGRVTLSDTCRKIRVIEFLAYKNLLAGSN